MRKLKCILGHNQRLMNLSDVTTEEYENNHETIKTYKCKHCGVIIGGKTLSVKPKTIFNKDIEEKEDKEELNSHDVKICEYQNWSEQNMRHRIDVFGENEKGVIYLVSNNEITEMEFMGIVFLAHAEMKRWDGLDINYKIYKAKYLFDSIEPKYYRQSGLTTYAISKYNKYVEINENMNIIAIEYDKVVRCDKSYIWRLFHRRICKGEYDYGDEY